MLLMNADAVREALPLPAAIAAMKRALVAMSSDNARLPDRIHLDMDQNNGTTLVMPGHFQDDVGEALTVKVVSIFNENSGRGLPNILGIVNVFDPETGKLIALLDASAVTAIRTAATSAAATDLLARKDATHLALIGSGVQAATHFHAISAIRQIQKVSIYSPNRSNVTTLVQKLTHDSSNRISVSAASSSSEATRNADIVCTVTNSSSPVIDDNAIRSGTHINAIGSYKPEVVEIPAATVIRSRVFVDHLQSALREAGDLIQPLSQGKISEVHLVGEVGQIVLGEIAGRTSDEEITLFKSVGNTAEDIIASQMIVKNATELGLGQRVEF